jgi:hypothetical protein
MLAKQVQAKQMLYNLSHVSSPFCCGYFGYGVCPSWPQIMILSILASQVARITGVSHLHLAIVDF